MADNETIRIQLTNREAQVLIALLEVAGKNIGYDAWEGCLALRARVAAAQAQPTPPEPAPPEPAPPEPTPDKPGPKRSSKRPNPTPPPE